MDKKNWVNVTRIIPAMVGWEILVGDHCDVYGNIQWEHSSKGKIIAISKTLVIVEIENDEEMTCAVTSCDGYKVYREKKDSDKGLWWYKSGRDWYVGGPGRRSAEYDKVKHAILNPETGMFYDPETCPDA